MNHRRSFLGVAGSIGTLLAFETLSPSFSMGYGPAGNLPDLGKWDDLISFRPPSTVQQAVIARGENFAVHRIEQAAGRLNLDDYSVHVERLPRVNGQEVSPEALLAHLRTHLNEFSDKSVATFEPLTQDDLKLLKSSNPTGAVVLIDMKLAGVGLDSGCVVVARSRPDQWIFSTIRAGGPGLAALTRRAVAVAHPVSGNRAFGFVRNKDGSFLFYNRAADRPTRGVDALSAETTVFAAADRLWKYFQARLVDHVVRNGGRARASSAEARRFDWKVIAESKHYNTKNEPAWVKIAPQ